MHLTVGRDDERVHLAEHRVVVDERVVELRHDGHDLLLLAGVLEARREAEPARLPGLEADERLHVELGERLGALGGDLLDIHAALGREHEERLLLAAVERDREVVLLRDVRGLLDPELPHDVAADVEAQDLARPRVGLVRCLRELDPARLAAPAGQHLGLDDDLPADLFGRRTRLLGARRHASLGDRDACTGEELLPLILVEVHGGASLAGTPNHSF